MIWLYRILFWPVFILLLPRYMYRLWRRKLPWHMGERFGKITPPQRKAGVRRIWIQAVSVGELRALRAFIDELGKNKGIEIVLSTTTTTGFEVARELYANKVAYLFSFPIDLFAKRVLQQIQPDRVILMESELWPELLYQANEAGIPVALINARVSDRSFKRLCKIPAGSRWIMAHLDRVLASSKHDGDRFIQLGVKPEKLSVTGNLKFDAASAVTISAEEKTVLLKSLGWNSSHTIILGSSTWAGEEDALLKAFAEARLRHTQARLLVVPRHAERGDEVEALLKSSGLTYSRRSRKESFIENPDVVLADTTGELGKLTALAGIVFVGKSLPPHTMGQTPIEAASLGKPLLYGQGMSSFPAVAPELAERGGARWVGGPMELKLAISELLAHPEKCARMGQAAADVFNQNRGATERTIRELGLGASEPVEARA
jgi:3-deoxy-D-manno-octulosonic-acid transferase